MAKNDFVFFLVLFLTPNLSVNGSAIDDDSFEDLGNVVLGAPRVEGRLRILQITDLHRFPKGYNSLNFHAPDVDSQTEYVALCP
jgi:hypothetical protein